MPWGVKQETLGKKILSFLITLNKCQKLEKLLKNSISY